MCDSDSSVLGYPVPSTLSSDLPFPNPKRRFDQVGNLERQDQTGCGSCRTAALRKELQRLQDEQTKLEEATEDRIRELAGTNDKRVRDSIQKSLVTLQKRTEQDNENRLRLDCTLDEVKALTSSKTRLLDPYTASIRSVLDSPEEARKPGLRSLSASLILGETHIETAYPAHTEHA